MTDEKVTQSSDNVFADLGFENPEEEMLKAKLVREIRAVIKSRRLTQAKAAALIGVKQPDVSAILAGRTQKYSIDRLLRSLRRLDCEVEISVRRKPERSPSPKVSA
jgi:predicted XRE-type DNA-binding protein